MNLKHCALSVKKLFSERFFPMVTKLAWSSIDLMTIWMMMILITSDAIFWNGYTKKLTVEEMRTTGWGHFGYLYHTQLFPQLTLWSYAFSTFIRKPNLRKCKGISNIQFRIEDYDFCAIIIIIIFRSYRFNFDLKIKMKSL